MDANKVLDYYQAERLLNKLADAETLDEVKKVVKEVIDHMTDHQM